MKKYTRYKIGWWIALVFSTIVFVLLLKDTIEYGPGFLLVPDINNRHSRFNLGPPMLSGLLVSFVMIILSVLNIFYWNKPGSKK